ncbi:MAG: hypothetical protein EOM62_20205 [Bacteroidia bacterium]|jgi:hypothetical protein|nr:hypothetical protein [Bacteroidia bacterium]
MGVRKTVFGSSMEKKCFRKLTETWAKDYNIYHNLPFLNVFTARTDLVNDELRPLVISDQDYDHLKKTSIDFTVCDKNDVPLVCLEFDGMQDGFNVGSNYHLRGGVTGRTGRRALIELKLGVAHGSGFPYLVLGSDEFRGLSDAVRLTIADGLIGEVLSSRAAHKRIDEGFEPTQCGYSQNDFDALSPLQQSEVITDWVHGIEIEADYQHNPIFKEVSRLSTALGASGSGMTFLNDAEHDSSKWVWMECYVTSSRYGTARAKVCLPDFKSPYCYFTVHLAQEIGHLLALEQLREHAK